jgi:hypothetical protein
VYGDQTGENLTFGDDILKMAGTIELV